VEGVMMVVRMRVMRMCIVMSISWGAWSTLEGRGRGRGKGGIAHALLNSRGETMPTISSSWERQVKCQ